MCEGEEEDGMGVDGGGVRSKEEGGRGLGASFSPCYHRNPIFKLTFHKSHHECPSWTFFVS